MLKNKNKDQLKLKRERRKLTKIKSNNWKMMKKCKIQKKMRFLIHQLNCKCKFSMRKRKRFVNSDKKKPRSKKFFLELNLLMSNIMMIINQEKTLELTAMQICKIWDMINKFINKNQKKRKKFISITILNVQNKTLKNFMKLEKQSLKKNRV